MSADRVEVLVLGTGGHARVVAALLAHTSHRVRGFLDRVQVRPGEAIGGHPVIGTFADLERLRGEGLLRVVLAIGENTPRAAAYTRARALGFEVMGLRHPTAIVEPGAVVAPDAVLCMGAMVGAEARVGANALLNSGSVVDHESVIGDHAHVAPTAAIAGRVTIGAGSFIGVGSSVADGRRIGAGVVVGAGAAVVTDLPDGVVAVGVPARVRSDLRTSWVAPS
jgi:UDP-perosamine 4-acetyltransferase